MTSATMTRRMMVSQVIELIAAQTASRLLSWGMMTKTIRTSRPPDRAALSTFISCEVGPGRSPIASPGRAAETFSRWGASSSAMGKRYWLQSSAEVRVRARHGGPSRSTDCPPNPVVRPGPVTRGLPQEPEPSAGGLSAHPPVAYGVVGEVERTLRGVVRALGDAHEHAVDDGELGEPASC